MNEQNGNPQSGPDPGRSPPPARPRGDQGQAAGSGREPGGESADNAPLELTQRIAELEDQRLRALADLDNLRKKCASQVSSARADARAEVAARWLPVVD